jgi:heme/copper-type cytochrome/quinol oxidase subunit 2
MPTVDPVGPDSPGPQPESPRGGGGRDSGMVGLIVAAVLVFVAVALAVAAFLVYRNASDAQARADRIERVTRQHAAVTASASRDVAALHAAADRSYTTLGALTAAYQAQLASQNHAIDIANGAAAAYNSGDANIGDALKTEAPAAVADAEAKTAAVHAALGQVKQAFATLQRKAG